MVCVRRFRYGSRAARVCTLVGLSALAAIPGGPARAVDDKGFALLHEGVAGACDCAEQRANGVAAAIQCNDFTREYATRSVEYRARWDDTDRRVEGRLRKLLEHCLSQAKGYRQSMDELGLLNEGLGAGIPPPSASPTWYRVTLAELSGRRGQLVRITTLDGNTVTGMLRDSSQTGLQVVLAARDGGGERAIRAGDVVGVKVLHLP